MREEKDYVIDFLRERVMYKQVGTISLNEGSKFGKDDLINARSRNELLVGNFR
jgi:hypothetical protein